jgi:Tfp pilus assembly protein PilP
VGAAQQPKDAKTDPAKAKKTIVESPVVYAGIRYQSGNRRDPFLNLLLLKKAQKPLQDPEEPRGQPPPGIGGMFIAQVSLLGIASQEGEPTAIFRGTDKRAYFLRQGDKLFDGPITKIDAEAVTLIRETRFKSGKVLKQEVIKRLRPQ